MQNKAKREKAVIALGMFDGVHIGHRDILERTLLRAGEQGALAVAVCLYIHPQASRGKTITLLRLTDEREGLFRRLGLIHPI